MQTHLQFVAETRKHDIVLPKNIAKFGLNDAPTMHTRPVDDVIYTNINQSVVMTTRR